ncbi:MAG: response regulator [Candidatus Firestonebacteria bacterium]|nr:response regulator [Candidatus Firestonebacteria bacterium]
MIKKILIMDDEPDVRKMVTGRLKKAGFDVIEAANGERGLEMLLSEKPDMVLLDLAMPGLDGAAVCRRIKADNATKNIPVMLFTASIIKPISESAKEMGADDYIAKPFDSKELLEKIRMLLSK